MSDCIFCKIAKKELPSDVVAENEDILVFKDIHPKAPLHYLIIPKNHIESIRLDNSGEIIRGLIEMAKKIAANQGVEGYRLLLNVGSWQIVPHMHLHFLAGGEESELKI